MYKSILNIMTWNSTVYIACVLHIFTVLLKTRETTSVRLIFFFYYFRSFITDVIVIYSLSKSLMYETVFFPPLMLNYIIRFVYILQKKNKKYRFARLLYAIIFRVFETESHIIGGQAETSLKLPRQWAYLNI